MTNMKRSRFVYSSKLKQKTIFRDEFRILIFSIVAGMSINVIDAAIDTFVFNEQGSFLDHAIFNVPPMEIYHRSITWAIFITFGIIVSRIFAKRRQAGEALRETNERVQALIQTIPDVVFFKDVQRRNMVVNKAHEKFVGLTQEEIVGKTDEQLLPKDLAEYCRKSDEEVLRKHETLRFEEQTIGEKGEKRFFETVKAPFYDSQGNVLGLVGVSHDITKRKQMEETLQESEGRYRNLIETSREVIYTLSAEDGTITSLNPAFEKLTGWSRAEWLGKSFTGIVHPDDLSLAIETFQRVWRGETVPSYELRVLSKSGGYVVGEFTSVPDIVNGKVIGEFGVARDITQRKKTEKELRESEQRFRRLSQSAFEGIVIHDQGKILDANVTFAKMFGYALSEVIGMQGLDLMAPESRNLVSRNILSGYEEPYEAMGLRKDDSTFPVEICGRAIPYKGTEARVTVVRDVTERTRVEEERRSYEARLSALNFYGGKLNAALTLQQAYEMTMDAMKETLGFEHAAFLMVEKGNLEIRTRRGYPEPLCVKLPLDGTKKGLTVRAAITGQPVLVSDVKKDKDYVETISGIRSELAVPVVVEDRVLGVLNVESKEVGAFDRKDVVLLQILSSHAATAINNVMRREEIEKRSSQMASLMRNSAEIIHTENLHRRLKAIAEAIRDLGWRRVVISVRDENMEMRSPSDLVTVGVTDEEREFLWNNKPAGQVMRERFGPEYERFKIGEFYHLPWSDPWVRSRDWQASAIRSHLKPEEMVDWNPQDELYAPLQLADGRIVGRLSMDDPVDGKRPTQESLAPLELFLSQAAVAIENAKLIQQLKDARVKIQEYADNLEMKVTERTLELKEAQNRLLKSERLAAIGELAGMVGHDLRNPLTGIAGAAYYLKTKFGQELGNRAKEMLEIIEKDIGFSNKIIDDLLEYSREIRLELSETNPKAMIREALSIMNISKDVQVVNLTKSKPKIKVDTEKMKRVFVNTIKNAGDAMPKGGTLTIESRELNGNLEITVTDTGTGIPREIAQKIFTPLFTTKAKGMGFGLSICKRIIEAHEGNISVESTVGKGTTFTITIPVSPQVEGDEVWVDVPKSSLPTTEVQGRRAHRSGRNNRRSGHSWTDNG